MTKLRHRFIGIVLVSGALAVFVVLGAAVAMYFVQQSTNFDQMASSLERSGDAQAEELAASFLIPEQKVGRQQLLNQYKKSENLNLIEVIEPKDLLPNGLENCLRSSQITKCKSADNKLIATLTPIGASTLQFGHLLKVKSLASGYGFRTFKIAVSALIAVLIVSGLSLILLLRLYKQMENSLSRLESWTSEVVLKDDEVQDSPNFNFHEISILGQNIKKLIQKGVALKKEAKGAEVAKQIAHDIRSPIHALNVLLGTVKEGEQLDPQTKKAISNSAQRICEISEDLLTKGHVALNSKKSEKSETIADLAKDILLIVQEKSLQIHEQEISIDFQSPQNEIIKTTINGSEFRRTLSNLLENAIQALGSKGSIHVRLTNGSQPQITIQDSGCGMPTKILQRLGEKGLSYGRKTGTGLGVYHAIRTLQNAGGDIHFQSKEGLGTTVTICLPTVKPTSETCSQIVVADDDQLIHQMWDKLFSKQKKKYDLLHFYSCDELRAWLSVAGKSAKRLYLIDYDLKQNESGLELIEDLNLQAHSVLVSSLADDPEIKSKAKQIGLRVLRKDHAEMLFQEKSQYAELA